MTDITTLRRWSAEDLLELEEVSPKSCIKPNTFFESNSGKIYICLDDPDIGWIDWTPDLPESGQIWLVVDKLRRLQLFIYLESHVDFYIAQCNDSISGCYYRSERHINPCHAILLAAKSALEAK